MRTILASALSFLFGLGLGWATFHGDVVVRTVEVTAAKPVAAPGPGASAALEVPTKPPDPAARATPPAPTAVSPSAAPPPTSEAVRDQEVLSLRAKVAQLEAALGTEVKLRAGTEGERVPVPAGLAPRLRDEKQLVSAFNAALKEAGFKGEVSSVDCSEHPCLVFGNGFGGRGDLEKLLPTSGFAAYAKDSMSTYGFQRGPDEKDPASRFFGVAVMPSDSESSDELKKRIEFRVRQMEQASRPTKK